MTAPRQMDHMPVTGMPRTSPTAWQDSKPQAGSLLHRNSRPRRPHLPDEERRLLREVEAALEGGERRPDADAALHGAWQAEEDGPLAEGPPSRLFRD